MARSFRKIPHWCTGKNYDSEFLLRLTKGLVEIPKPAVGKGGFEVWDEIWTPEAKRLAKHLRTRHERRLVRLGVQFATIELNNTAGEDND